RRLRRDVVPIQVPAQAEEHHQGGAQECEQVAHDRGLRESVRPTRGGRVSVYSPSAARASRAIPGGRTSVLRTAAALIFALRIWRRPRIALSDKQTLTAPPRGSVCFYCP